MIGRRDDPAFLYFPCNYRWSMGLLICLGAAPWTGIEIDEVHRVGRALEEHVGDDTAWFAEWVRMGDKIEARGREEERRGHRRTAASCFLRASRYYQTGERFIHPRSPQSHDVYAKSVNIFKEAAAAIRRPRIEPVEVPYENTSLPALLVHPDPADGVTRPAPCMVFLDGFDVTKEGGAGRAFQEWRRQHPEAETLCLNGETCSMELPRPPYKDACGLGIIHKSANPGPA